jgi:hypothetical protein
MLSFSSSSMGQPSLVDWVLGTLETGGPQTLEQLANRLPDVNWAQLLLAVDYLSRKGRISIDLVGRGDYIISFSKSEAPFEALHLPPGPAVATPV